MSDNYMDDDFDSESESPDSGPGDIKSLRRAANSKKQLERELEEVRKELAFARAGINLDDPKMKYFVKGYDGEMSSDAVRQAALEAGFLAATSAQQAQQAQQVQQLANSQQNVMAASVGAIAEDMSEDSALAKLESAMNEGGMTAMLDVARQYGIPIGSEM